MKKKDKKIAYISIIALGGCLVGYAANQLNTFLGIMLFTIGMFMLIIASLEISKL